MPTLISLVSEEGNYDTVLKVRPHRMEWREDRKHLFEGRQNSTTKAEVAVHSCAQYLFDVLDGAVADSICDMRACGCHTYGFHDLFDEEAIERAYHGLIECLVEMAHEHPDAYWLV